MILVETDSSGRYSGHVDIQESVKDLYLALGYFEAEVPPSRDYVWKNGQWTHSPDVIEFKNAQIRKRNSLLSASDWTQLPDVPLATKEAWAVYRQKLRDITKQSGFPKSIEWPLAPK